jgi:hypothetical protein
MINVVLKHHCGSDLSVVNSARVSFDKESSSLSDKDEKLIHYLAKHKHTSPFGHAFVTFKVDAPVFGAVGTLTMSLTSTALITGGSGQRTRSKALVRLSRKNTSSSCSNSTSRLWTGY